MAPRIRLRRPSPAMVVACVALFVALGGLGYAAVKLPRNSVGTAQLKNSAVSAKKIQNGAVLGTKLGKNAVSSAKIADDQVTGADVDESSLGQVPSAASATNATNATNAGNAATVGGLAPSTFARADRLLAGDADPGSASPVTLIQIPNGPRWETKGLGSLFEVRVVNSSADTWELSNDKNAIPDMIAPSAFVFIGITGYNVATWMARNASHPERYALVECAFHSSPNRIECFARLSPAL